MNKLDIIIDEVKNLFNQTKKKHGTLREVII